MGLALQAHIREAQKHVDSLTAQNQLKALDDQLQIDLKKTTNSSQVKGVLDEYTGPNGKLNQVVKDWGKSPASVEIQMAASVYKPSMDNLGQARQLTLLGQENTVNTDLQIKTLLPQLVTAHRSGDVTQEQQIRSHIDGLYDDAVSKGLMTTAEKELNIDALREAIQKQINEASIMSPNAAERKQAIEQLTKGGSGPLDLTNLAPGDINALREHAQEADKTLTGLSEAQSLNGALNIMNSAFAAPEFKDNFDAQQHALQDPQWLKDHGIVAEDGKPDYIMADKLQQQVSVQRAYREKEQQDHAEDFVNKLSPLIDENKVSLAQVNRAVDESGLSGKALATTRAALVRQWTTNARTNHEFAIWDRQQAEQEKRQKSEDTASTYMMQIMGGGLPSLLTIRTDPNMTSTDKAQVTAAVTASEKQDPNFQAALKMIGDAFPEPTRPGTTSSPATPEQLQQYSAQDEPILRQRAQVYNAWMARINANPSENKIDALKDVVNQGVQKDIADRLNSVFDSQSNWFTSGEWIKGNQGRAPSNGSWESNRTRHLRRQQTKTLHREVQQPRLDRNSILTLHL